MVPRVEYTPQQREPSCNFGFDLSVLPNSFANQLLAVFANISVQISSVASHSCPQPNAKPALLSLRSQITCGGRPQPVS